MGHRSKRKEKEKGERKEEEITPLDSKYKFPGDELITPVNLSPKETVCGRESLINCTACHSGRESRKMDDYC